jgi:hypothetical protein
MKIMEKVHKCGAEKSIADGKNFSPGTEEKSKEFVEAGVKIYAKA